MIDRDFYFERSTPHQSSIKPTEPEQQTAASPEVLLDCKCVNYSLYAPRVVAMAAIIC